jgi:hypothetical protein
VLPPDSDSDAQEPSCIADCTSEPATCSDFWAFIGEGGCAHGCSDQLIAEFAEHAGCPLALPAEVVVVTVPAEMTVEIAEVPAAGSSEMKVRRNTIFSASPSPPNPLFTGARRRS